MNINPIWIRILCYSSMIHNLVFVAVPTLVNNKHILILLFWVARLFHRFLCWPTIIKHVFIFYTHSMVNLNICPQLSAYLNIAFVCHFLLSSFSIRQFWKSGIPCAFKLVIKEIQYLKIYLWLKEWTFCSTLKSLAINKWLDIMDI